MAIFRVVTEAEGAKLLQAGDNVCRGRGGDGGGSGGGGGLAWRAGELKVRWLEI